MTLLAACGSDDETDPGQASPAAESPAAGESPAESESPDTGGVTVRVADSDLGQILVDADGMTLYLFEADTDGTSTCYDECADTWPPLIDAAPTAGGGIDQSLVDTTERDGGELQVTYAGHPLYLYAPDQAPGDTEGQGVGDVWFVVDAAGAAVTTRARTSRY